MKRAKTLLILGGGHSDIPLIKSAKKMGYYVITSGNDINALGHKYSDEYIGCDYSDKVAMLKIVEKLKVDEICPCANDFSAVSCSYISEKTGIGNFDPYKVSKIIHRKDEYRKFAQENGINTPRAKGFHSISEVMNEIEKFSFPIIIKPVDLSGGKGISKVEYLDKSEIKEKVKVAFMVSKANKIVVEEFIEGSNHGLSLLLRDKKVIFDFCDNEYYYKNQYLVSGAYSPSTVSRNIINKLIHEAEKISSLLELKDGILHIQFILKNDLPYIIEICRRPPGDLYIDLVKYSTGFDYANAILRSFIRKRFVVRKKYKKDMVTRHCIMASANGTIEKVEIKKELNSNIIKKVLWYKQGDNIDDYMTYKAGIIFLKFASVKEMNFKNSQLSNLIEIKIKNEKNETSF